MTFRQLDLKRRFDNIRFKRGLLDRPGEPVTVQGAIKESRVAASTRLMR